MTFQYNQTQSRIEKSCKISECDYHKFKYKSKLLFIENLLKREK